jgi:hypothetical protein
MRLAKLLVVLFLINVASSKIFVSHPETLSKEFKGPLSAKYSVFGSLKYGFTTNGRLYYDPTNLESDYACKPIKTIQFENIDDIVPIVMVDRGDCTFVTKVRNVQNIGGAIALIVNNQEDEKEIFGLNDDGTGSDIKIPGILITKKDGEILKKFFNENKDNKDLLSQIVLSIDNSISFLADKVEMKLDFLPNDRKVYNLLNKLSMNKDLIGHDNIKIVPNYITKNGFKYNAKEEKVYQNCFCNGRYCQTVGEYASSTFLKVDALPILTESVRQKCLYNVSQGGKDYFEYMNMFYKNCVGAYPMDFSIACSEKVLAQISGALVDKVNECYKNSFQGAIGDERLTCKKNTILEGDSNAVEKKLKNALPIIYVNDYTFYGSWTNENVLEAICAVIKDKPNSCFTQLDVFDDNFTHLNTSHLLWIGLAFVLFNVVIFLLCRQLVKRKIENKMTSEDINDKIGTIVHNYLKMRDQKE